MKLADLIRRRRKRAPDTNDLDCEAANWLVQRQAGAGYDEESFRAWLARSHHHAAAFAKMEGAWTQLDRPRSIGEAETVRELLALRSLRRKRRIAQAGFAVAALAVGGCLLTLSRQGEVMPPPQATIPTIAQRPDVRGLPDGSTLQLNSGVEFLVEYTAAERRVRLDRGEAVFDVMRDQARPFVVTAGGVRIRAVGTKFFVRHDSGRIDVLVTEGTVGVARATGDSDSAAEVMVSAGRRASIPLAELAAGTKGISPADVRSVTSADISQELAWRGNRIEFTGTSLVEAVDWFNRRNTIQIEIAEPSLKTRQVTGICWVDDPAGFARLLETGLGISIEEKGSTIVLR